MFSGERGELPTQREVLFLTMLSFSRPIGSNFPGATDGHGLVPEPIQTLLVSAVTWFCNLLPGKRRDTTVL